MPKIALQKHSPGRSGRIDGYSELPLRFDSLNSRQHLRQLPSESGLWLDLELGQHDTTDCHCCSISSR